MTNTFVHPELQEHMHGLTLAQRLQKLRERQGLSRRAMSHEAGMTESTIYKIEVGDTEAPTLPNIEKMASVLGYKVVLIPKAEADKRNL